MIDIVASRSNGSEHLHLTAPIHRSRVRTDGIHVHTGQLLRRGYESIGEEAAGQLNDDVIHHHAVLIVAHDIHADDIGAHIAQSHSEKPKRTGAIGHTDAHEVRHSFEHSHATP